MRAKLTSCGNFEFLTEIRNHQLTQDAKTEGGGQNKGPTPKELLLAAIAGCTGMDVVSLLKKMRVNYQSFEVDAQAETTDTHPKTFQEVVVDFKLTGEDIDLDKVQKSVDMSLTKYCGVSAMVWKVSPIKYQILLNGEVKATGFAKFEN
jgi:putative redox protein